MTETLIVENDEAYALARELAERRGVSLEEAVVASLRSSLYEPKPARTRQAHGTDIQTASLNDLTPGQRADYESLRALARRSAASKCAGSTSDHGDMYGEDGLPI